jgi:hypothetical protein
MLTQLKKNKYQIEVLSHAEAILTKDFPEALKELEAVLVNFKIPVQELISSGGGEAAGTQRLRKAFAERNWLKSKFEIKKTINNIERESITHEIDHVRTYTNKKSTYNIALEIEWNNKDPFFDRDLENFKRLHAEGAISAGIIITRGSSLQDKIKELILNHIISLNITSIEDIQEIFNLEQTRRQKSEVLRRTERGEAFADAWTDQFVSDKFGTATTHWKKLQDRIDRGVGNPCPLLLIGLPQSIIIE